MLLCGCKSSKKEEENLLKKICESQIYLNLLSKWKTKCFSSLCVYVMTVVDEIYVRNVERVEIYRHVIMRVARIFRFLQTH